MASLVNVSSSQLLDKQPDLRLSAAQQGDCGHALAWESCTPLARCRSSYIQNFPAIIVIHMHFLYWMCCSRSSWLTISQVGQAVDDPVPASSAESNTFMFAAVGIVAVLVLGVVWITARSRKTSNPAHHSDGDAHGAEFTNIADAQAAAEAQETGKRA